MGVVFIVICGCRADLIVWSYYELISDGNQKIQVMTGNLFYVVASRERHWQTKLLDRKKVTKLNLLRQKSVRYDVRAPLFAQCGRCLTCTEWVLRGFCIGGVVLID